MTTAEYVNYFKEAAKSNKVLKHLETPNRITFCKMNIDEILTLLKTDLVGTSMVLENFQKRGQDLLSDNKRKIITGAFLIIKYVESGNFDAEIAALDETEAVAEQILAKITNDNIKFRHSKNHPWKIKGFDPNSVRQNVVVNLFDGWFGWRTEFSIDQTFRNNLQLVNDEWLNDTKFTL